MAVCPQLFKNQHDALRGILGQVQGGDLPTKDLQEAADYVKSAAYQAQVLADHAFGVEQAMRDQLAQRPIEERLRIPTASELAAPTQPLGKVKPTWWHFGAGGG